MAESDFEKAWNLIQKVLSSEKDSNWKDKLDVVLDDLGIMGEFDIFKDLDRDQLSSIALALKPGPQNIFMKALNISK